MLIIVHLRVLSAAFELIFGKEGVMQNDFSHKIYLCVDFSYT